MSYDPHQQPTPPPYQPGPPQYGPQQYQPGYGPPAGLPQTRPILPPGPPPRKGWHPLAVIAVIGAGVLMLLLAVGTLANLSGKGTDPGAPAVGQKKPAVMGAPVRDGKFEFVVKSVKCGQKKTGSGFLSEEAQGVFCLVDVQVSNIGKEAQTFSGSDQKLIDKAGKEYSNDSGAEWDVNSDVKTWGEDINPGNKISGTLVFDVPAGTKPVAIILHDSLFSDGVRVSLLQSA